MSQMKIYAAWCGDAYVVRLEGELDLAGCPELVRVLDEAERSDAERIFLDLEDLTFMAVRGATTIHRATCRSAARGSRLQISRGTGQVERIFQLLRLDSLLPFTDAALVPQPKFRDDARAGAGKELEARTQTTGAVAA